MNAPEIAMRLLREVSTKGWKGRRAIVAIDPVCRFGGTDCGQPLWAAFALEHEKAAHILCLCEDHAKVMEEAIEEWRKMS